MKMSFGYLVLPDVLTQTVYNEKYKNDNKSAYDGVKSREILTLVNGGTWRNKRF